MSELSPVQQRLLQMMVWYHDFCVSHNLRYYMIGGTMLGAVRHKGFIPWDDDIDVGMPRPDYQHFLELLEGRREGVYTAESYLGGALDYTYPFAKLYDTSTTLTEEKRPPVRRGLFIDVFPLDGTADTEEWRRGYRTFRRNKNLLSVLTAEKHEHYSGKLKLLIAVSRLIPGKTRIAKTLQRKIDDFCRSAPFDDARMVGNLVGSRKEKEPLPAEVFGTPALYPFEGQQFYGVAQADRYLTLLIGDYMTLPPESEQRGHLTVECNLERGYM